MDVWTEARRLAAIATYFVWVGWFFVIYALIAGIFWFIDLAGKPNVNWLQALGLSPARSVARSSWHCWWLGWVTPLGCSRCTSAARLSRAGGRGNLATMTPDGSKLTRPSGRSKSWSSTTATSSRRRAVPSSRSIPSFVDVGPASTGEEGLSMAATVYPGPGPRRHHPARHRWARDVPAAARPNPAPLVVLCSVDDDPRVPGLNLPCSDSPYISKTAFSRSAPCSKSGTAARSAERRRSRRGDTGAPHCSVLGAARCSGYAKHQAFPRLSPTEVSHMTLGPS